MINMPPKKKSGSAKSKEKKLKWKQEQAEVAASLSRVKVAYDEVNEYMESLPAFQKYSRNELDVAVSLYRMADLTKDDVKWAFDLMKECVEELYVSGGWGWNDRKKWDELTHDSACFLMAREVDSDRPVGFVNFRFDLDDNVEVIYCYEIHMCPEVRRKGLGKFLMQIVELIGHKANMTKVVLTVFKDNGVSNAFFRDRMKYVDDDTSPIFTDPLNEQDYTYSILSKPLIKKPTKPAANSAKPVARASGHSNEAQRAQNGNPRPLHRAKIAPPKAETSDDTPPTASGCHRGDDATARVDDTKDSPSCLDANTEGHS
ncbi:N-alpha-acetyltransferase 40-like [Halichondria panicea]|uniref:N-alpha-acetyltransferase 40-like n=1 Tax=Halichondria panicea TaxID=6063 RepID=UPI00312B522E